MLACDSEPLFTERLCLRRPVASDAAATIAIVGDWEVARRLGRVPHPYQGSDYDYFLAQVVPNEPTWAIVLRETGDVIGMTSLVAHKEQSSAEIGYYLGRTHWGRGLATESARAVVRFGLDRMRCDKLTSRYHTDNPASGHVLTKLGFKPVGKSSHFCLAEGKEKPAVEMELLA